MSQFDSMLASISDAFIEPFGERAVFKPAGGRPHVIYPIVDRHPLMPDEQRAAVKMLSIWIAKDRATGIITPPVANADKVNLAWNIGDDPSDFMIAEITSQDGGGWQVTLK